MLVANRAIKSGGMILVVKDSLRLNNPNNSDIPDIPNDPDNPDDLSGE